MHAPAGDPQPRPAPAPVVRRRSWPALLALVAVAVVGVPSAATAALAGHRAAAAVRPDDPEAVPWYTDDPAIVGELRDLSGELRLPQGAGYDDLLRRYPTSERMITWRPTLRAEVAGFAACAWYRDWLDGDQARRAADQPVIDTVPSWPQWHFPEGSAGRRLLTTISQETGAGEVTSIRLYLAVNC